LDLIWDNPQHTNHWVASIPIGSGDDHSHGDGESEVTDTFYGTYLSLSMRIETTVADGDCGLDVMCLMLGCKRCKHNRDSLRSEMAAFALKHVGNRAFIAMLHSVGELTTHLGLFELGSAGAELVVSSALEEHHGDGGGALVDAGTPEAAQRNFSDEEISAVTWKCRLQKSSPEFINELLRRLPLECIKQTVEEYQKRAPAEAQKDTPAKETFLVSRDALESHKLKAAGAFLQWCEEIHGPIAPKHRELLKCANIPYGWFAD